MVFRFIEFGEQDRWGKRKPKLPHIPFWVSDQSHEILEAAGALDCLSLDGAIGIDLVGSGSGQWQLYLDVSGDLLMVAGLTAAENALVIEGDTGDIAFAGEGSESSVWQDFFESALAAKI